MGVGFAVPILAMLLAGAPETPTPAPSDFPEIGRVHAIAKPTTLSQRRRFTESNAFRLPSASHTGFAPARTWSPGSFSPSISDV